MLRTRSRYSFSGFVPAKTGSRGKETEMVRPLQFSQSHSAGCSLGLILGFLCFGCANTVEITVREAAEMRIDKEFSRVAIPSFSSPNAPGVGELIASKLRQGIRNEGVYSVVGATKEQLDQLKDVLRDSTSRLADEDQTLEIGRLEIPEVFVFGTVAQYEAKQWPQKRTAYRQVQVGETEGYDQYGNPIRIPVYEQQPYEVTDTVHQATLGVTFSVYDIETSRNLIDDPYQRTRESIFRGQEAAGSDVANALVSAFSSSETPVTAAQMLDQMVEEAVSGFVRKFSPHRVTKLKTFLDGDDGQIALGIEMAERGNWDEAARIWRESMAAHQSAAAANNLGIYYERAEDPDRARKLYRQAMNLAPHEDAPKDNLATLSSYSKTSPESEE